MSRRFRKGTKEGFLRDCDGHYYLNGIIIIFVTVVMSFMFLALFSALIPLLATPAYCAAMFIGIILSYHGLFFLYERIKKLLHYSCSRVPSDEELFENKSVKDRHNKIILSLLDIMNHEKIFLNSSLTLKDLAAVVSVQPYQLSRILNEDIGKNFADFINQYRIEEVMKRITDDSYSQFTILGIAYDCGFNSKSVFNSAFKKITKMTPTEYKKYISSEKMMKQLSQVHD